MPRISIIVPVYNVEKYLEKCIKSILNQTLQDFELILVNDGSTDDSGRICDEFAEKDNRIIVIHKENEGLSKTRNVALDIAKGEYIGFIDSDDWIEPSMYEVLYNLCCKYDADISSCAIKESTSKSNVKTRNKIVVKNGKDMIVEIYSYKYSGISPCNKLYKSKIYKNIRFPNKKLNEDAAIMYKIYDISDKVVHKDAKLYNYLIREGSLMHSKFNKDRFEIIDIYNEMLEYFQENCDMKKKIISEYFNSLVTMIKDIISENSLISNVDSLKKIESLFRKKLLSIILNKNIYYKSKIFLIIYCISYKLGVRFIF